MDGMITKFIPIVSLLFRMGIERYSGPIMHANEDEWTSILTIGLLGSDKNVDETLFMLLRCRIRGTS